VLAAARLVAHQADLAAKPTFDEVFARMIVAWQSFLSGAIDHGLDMSRSAVALADANLDVTLRITGRLFLAAMLNMSVRAWDEAATTTAEAHRLAQDAQRNQDQAVARSILAGSELMRGDYRAALVHAQTGAALSDESGARALNLAFQSAVESDIGHFDDALSHALNAIGYAEITADPVQLAYAHAYAAHAEIVAGRHESARPHALRALDACSSVLVLKPWPMAMLAEIQVHAGDLHRAAATAAEADGLAIVTGISYQRALAQRAVALAEAAAGDDVAALERLVVALAHARRTGGQGYAFHWPVAWVLESLASIAARSRPDEAKRWAAALKDHASATGMTTFAARADHLTAFVSTS
jgi:tetratricopeptide (TPR) repeat protein